MKKGRGAVLKKSKFAASFSFKMSFFKNIAAAVALSLGAGLGSALGQRASFELSVRPVFKTEKIALGQPIVAAGADSLTLSALRFYLGDFVFWKNGKAVFEDERLHLFDLEDETAMRSAIDLPRKARFDSLSFILGVDSSTTANGAMGGDLDPVRGMFWTWQSGYINVKIEGFSKKCPLRGGFFEFHLGGHSGPFAAARRAGARLSKARKGGSPLSLWLDLSPFFEAIDWTARPSAMSPGAEAARLSEILAKSIKIDEK